MATGMKAACYKSLKRCITDCFVVKCMHRSQRSPSIIKEIYNLTQPFVLHITIVDIHYYKNVVSENDWSAASALSNGYITVPSTIIDSIYCLTQIIVSSTNMHTQTH